ncbi:Lymphocyte cytosolic protein 2 [Galemys pyrenaicus]|uniref:Lymphocyte cytosolic protein 2 n=1 Tax=Galemys pyrenaicus TaxID=202257 RepID=A0A8J6AHG0_GALPY|nr:Lymphocyte cytosolic protein 2 [Galemys pyrenaicus]
MALRNVPFRSEVLAWDSESLADYFKKLNYKDCEKAVKKYHIDGPRFLNLTENDIQKFPKLRVPILSKLSQDINKNEERRSIFARKPQVQRFPEDREKQQVQASRGPGASTVCLTRSLCWQDEDDYESPNEDQEEEGDGDYESPTEDEGAAPVDDDADYEPPPSNDEDAIHNSILPAKPLPNSMYIDRPASGNVQQQPPVPPQRPQPGLPPPTATRNHMPLPPPQLNHEEPSRSRNHKTAKIPAPSIDRSTKPPLDRSLAPFDREPFTPGCPTSLEEGKCSVASVGGHMVYVAELSPGSCICSSDILPLLSAGLLGSIYPRYRSLLCHQPQKDMKEALSREWGRSRLCQVHQRPLPPPVLPSMSPNNFSPRPTKQASKFSHPAPHNTGGFPESNSGFPHSASLPPYFSKGPSNRMQPRIDRNFSLPVSGKPRPPSPGEEESPLNEEWYVSYITRPEAEAALRKINQDGTFLVRDSSKKTITNPYVLMVLYKDKVYNIQIRYQEESQVYLLGTGLRGKEDFLSVSDIIDYFRKMPLLLIDGKNRGSRYQCTLTNVDFTKVFLEDERTVHGVWLSKALGAQGWVTSGAGGQSCQWTPLGQGEVQSFPGAQSGLSPGGEKRRPGSGGTGNGGGQKPRPAKMEVLTQLREEPPEEGQEAQLRPSHRGATTLKGSPSSSAQPPPSVRCPGSSGPRRQPADQRPLTETEATKVDKDEVKSDPHEPGLCMTTAVQPHPHRPIAPSPQRQGLEER